MFNRKIVRFKRYLSLNWILTCSTMLTTTKKSLPCSSPVKSPNLICRTSCLSFSAEKLNVVFQKTMTTRSYTPWCFHIHESICPCVRERYANVQYHDSPHSSDSALLTKFVHTECFQVFQQKIITPALYLELTNNSLDRTLYPRHASTQTRSNALCLRGNSLIHRRRQIVKLAISALLQCSDWDHS